MDKVIQFSFKMKANNFKVQLETANEKGIENSKFKIGQPF